MLFFNLPCFVIIFNKYGTFHKMLSENSATTISTQKCPKIDSLINLYSHCDRVHKPLRTLVLQLNEFYQF